jgi:hypothetical protein
MDKTKYTIYYNAISSRYGNYLYAVGWTTRSGITIELVANVENNNFKLKTQVSEVGSDMITPFGIIEKISGNPKSIHITDDYGTHQVQVSGIKEGASGENDSGIWVYSGEKL